jgi:UDPglucose--hexose-1-phosphate uridylyltransferase
VAEVRVDPLSGLRTIISDAAQDWTVPAPLPATPVTSTSQRVLDPSSPEPEAEANRDLFWSGPARGEHEVIVNAEDPVTSLGALSAEQVGAAVDRWGVRMAAHDDAAALHLSVEDGHGGQRSCAELFALDFVPAALARERERFGAYATRTMGGNLLSDLVQEEVRRRVRVVAIDDESVLLSAFAARAPYQLLIAPRRARARFQDDGPTGATMLHAALRRLAARFGGPAPVHVWVRSAPRGAEHFSWRIDLVPALGTLDGLAAGTGVHINPVAPERAAAELRELSL